MDQVKLTVLGIGNILMADEGVGVRLMEAVRDAQPWPAEVEFVDGGVGGLNLLTVLERAKHLIVFDAAEMHLPPGEFRVISPDQVAEDSAGRLSLHELSFIETLNLARQYASGPDDVTIFAVQPGIVAHGRELSPAMLAAMPRLMLGAGELVRQKLAQVI